MRVPIFAVVSGIILLGVVAESSDAVQKSRTMPFSLSVPIEARLLPDDEIVVIEKGGSGSMNDLASTAMGRGPLSEQLDILARADGIAVGEILRTQGELVEKGTWIRTIARLRLTEVIREKEPIAKSGVAEITFPDGELTLRGVTIKAGIFPILPPGRQVMVFLNLSRSCSCWVLGEAYLISDTNTLDHVWKSSGTEFSFRKSMLNQPLQEVIEGLQRRMK